MNVKRKLVGTALCVLLLVLMLVPVSLVLSLGGKEAHRQSLVIARMHERYQAYLEQDAGCAVGGMMDIEEIWALEDTRSEADGLLVTAMKNDGTPLGFDASSNTFYCTLGENCGETWPEIALTAQGEQTPDVVFIDDYTYDYCSDAIREGYRYEMLAYTDTEYSYIGIVFTALPIVAVNAGCSFREIGFDSDEASVVSISSAGDVPIEGGALIHQRGGRYDYGIEKYSYHLEFHELRTGKGDDKRSVSPLGMPADSDWLLLSNPADPTAVRNEMTWGIWDEMQEEDGPEIGTLESRLVELFMDNEYMGLYQLMQRVLPERELVRMGGDPQTDLVFKKIRPINKGDRPQKLMGVSMPWSAELRHVPPGMSEEEAFGYAERFVLLEERAAGGAMLDDAAFEQFILEHFDVRELMNYYVFLHATALGADNVQNNVFVWVIFDGDGGYTYHLSPWDLDYSFMPILLNDDGSPMQEINRWMYMCERMLDLDVGGSRQIFWEIWNRTRSTIMESSAIYQRIEMLEERINRSGAYLRESERWYGEAQELDLSMMRAIAENHPHTVEVIARELWPLEEQE
ncbi:MAG: CotH kinase family protein [Clostridia bacterium]|nr:CotH kinase family protein [Clostridia bacterium]